MLDAATGAIGNLQISNVILAMGGLGTAAYGLVDASKGFGGGISNRGFGDIRRVIATLLPPDTGGASELGLPSVLATLRANWLNGMALGDQKSIAKALIKLNLNPVSAGQMASATGVDAALLISIAEKLPTGATLSHRETEVYGRFDLLLSALLDQAYQRADQRYRNSAKLLAVPIAVALALLGAWALNGGLTWDQGWKAVVAGLLATPLAPIAKDLASAVQAGAKVAQAWTK